MNLNSELQSTTSPTSGARFFKCALQVNPAHYRGTYQGSAAEFDGIDYYESIVRKAVDLKIDVLAITDHNSFDGVAPFHKAALETRLTILPGFELASAEGVHVLCIYSPDKTDQQLARFLGEFGVRSPNPSTELSTCTLVELLAKVREQGGVSIAAHASSSSGILRKLTGQARINAWLDPNLLAIQIPGTVDILPSSQRTIVRNEVPEYRRHPQTGARLALAAINAKDVTEPSDLDHSSATCWIKMSEVNVEGLIQSFLDPDSRIRLNSDPTPGEHSELMSLSWTGGFLDGTIVNFNPNLNVLIGGRGAGKSTVIESLRYALGLEPIGDDAKRLHDGIVSQVLQMGTTISVTVRSHGPASRVYRVVRKVPNPPEVYAENGELLNLQPDDVLPNIEVFGQHEISELTRSPEKLTSLLNRFTVRDEKLERKLAIVGRNLQKNRQSLIGVSEGLEDIELQLAALPRLEEALKRFQEAGLAEFIQQQSLLVREERVLDSVPDRIQPFKDGLELFNRELPIDRTFLSVRALSELPGQEILDDMNPALDKLGSSVLDAVRRIEDAINRAETDIASVRSRWQERKSHVESKLSHVTGSDTKSSEYGAEFLRVRREIEALKPLAHQRLLHIQSKSGHETRRKELLRERVELNSAKSDSFVRAANSVNASLRNRVQVQVKVAGNREPLVKLLREEIGGRLRETVDLVRDSDNLTPSAFAESCRKGADALRFKFDMPLAQANRLASTSPHVLMRIEELELTPSTVVKLNVAPPGQPAEWKSLDSLSTGQKATAILLILLLESDEPLVVDQPEDDLDNRFITEGVVPKMREEKRRRQFIFSTHNANIPVLGDAELILGLTPNGEAKSGTATINAQHMGAIDHAPIRELVEEVLEGGKEAFQTRKLKYGF